MEIGGPCYCDGYGRLDRPVLARRDMLALGLTGLTLFTARSGLAQAAFRKGGEEGHVLVVLFLRGGADALNVIAPYGDDEYFRARPSLALRNPNDRGHAEGERLLDLDGFFGMNRALEPLLPEFREGRMAVVHAAGSGDSTHSHFEAMSLMESGSFANADSARGGWIARYLESTRGSDSPLRAVAFSGTRPDMLAGAPSAVTIPNLAEYGMATPEGVDRTRLLKALSGLYAMGSDAISEAGRETLAVLDALRAADPHGYRPEAPYPETDLGRAFKQVAFLVKNRLGLEVACLESLGWDSHITQGTSEGWLFGLLKDVGTSLAAFHKDLGGESIRVTTVVMSEFGRRIEENSGFGTDHGRGGCMLLFGDRLAGGRVHGTWPGLAKSRQTEPGDLLVTTDYRDVLAEVVRGRLRPVPMQTVFPGLDPKPIGLLA
ncbi:MAG: DUF1501 domain-containing protein [Fimbriimonadaceae bacterium]|nr:DUF1501 domain-containing protein [Fimbriimonadaceae bacterium]QYK54846.1 MAG: DUF1501 domain-containing protein [Fimbriimonadaceae bacterium]